MLCARAGINYMCGLLHRRGIGARRVLIYGAGKAGCMLARRLSEFPAFGLLAVGFVDDNQRLAGMTVAYDPARERALPVMGTGEHLQEIMAASNADEVLVAMPSGLQDSMRRIVRYCHEHHLAFRFMPHMYDLEVQRTVTQDLAGMPLIALREPSERYLYLLCKRAFDAVTAGLLLALLAPFLLLVALIIRLSSPGPALFVQERIGLNGVPFRMYKFRTMHANANPYETTPQSAIDARITRFGRWLRRTSFDEVPQLFNVLLGQMSLVGPRPEMPFIVAQYNELQRMRLHVKPGITGLWQISADRRVAIHENMDYDMFYLHEQSFLLDVVILIQTVVFAFRGI